MAATTLSIPGAAGAVVVLGLGLAALVMALALMASGRRSHRRRVGDVERQLQEAARDVEVARRERAGLETLLSALDDGIVMFGADGSVLYRNPAAERLLHGKVERLSDLTPPELRASVKNALAGESQPLVDVSMGPSSVVGALVVRLPAGQVMLSLQDVTRARRLDAVRRDFVANASHELKTPAASIQALAETLADASHQDPTSVPRFADQLRIETERLTRVVSDLLDLSRLEGGPLLTASVRLDQVAEEETHRLSDRARIGGQQLAATSTEPLKVAGSERDLRLLVRNLVENALQYTPPGGTVDVSTRAEIGDAVLTVRDTGVGIPSRDRARIFERFYRVDRARSRETGGTGLGLSIVKHVAENHRGSVSVDSEMGKGSTFTVRLPLAAAESDALSLPGDPSAPGSARAD